VRRTNPFADSDDFAKALGSPRDRPGPVISNLAETRMEEPLELGPRSSFQRQRQTLKLGRVTKLIFTDGNDSKIA
jgi:hypothetical protein